MLGGQLVVVAMCLCLAARNFELDLSDRLRLLDRFALSRTCHYRSSLSTSDHLQMCTHRCREESCSTIHRYKRPRSQIVQSRFPGTFRRQTLPCTNHHRPDATHPCHEATLSAN